MATQDTLSTHARYEVFHTSETYSAGDQFARDVAEGLSSYPKYIPSKYFYDDRGSCLFQQITELDEYYVTNCEIDVIERSKGAIAQLMAGEPFRLIELGVGDGRKTRPLLEEFLDRGLSFEFVPIDICREIIAGLTHGLGNDLASPRLQIKGIVGDYCDALGLLNQRDARRNLVLFMGSNIGNMDGPRSRSFLGGLRDSLAPGDVAMIGFDLMKDLRVLQAAYDDSKGVTREFNLNLLDRMNRELGASFDRGLFQHHALFNVLRGRMESWLISTEPQTVAFDALDEEFYFDAWEGIHLENSYKFTIDRIEALAGTTGFEVEEHLLDDRGWFVDSLWRAV